MLPDAIARRLRLPLISAPMLRVSGPDLVVAACRAGVIGAFPTKNARDDLDGWISTIRAALQPDDAPWCPNLIIRDPGRDEALSILLRHRPEVVITSVGSPAPVVGPLHDVGAVVLADVATLAHAEKALEAGADGLVLLTAGAGGNTGWLNPFAFVRAVRRMFDGPLVLAGGMADGQALYAARVLGCDLAYMGTKFIATCESLAAEPYRQLLVESSIDEVTLTRHFTGMRASFLTRSIRNAGLDPDALDEVNGPAKEGPRRWSEVWSAGHSVAGVDAVLTVQQLVDQTAAEYEAARTGSV